jgi:hypothetical protein
MIDFQSPANAVSTLAQRQMDFTSPIGKSPRRVNHKPSFPNSADRVFRVKITSFSTTLRYPKLPSIILCYPFCPPPFFPASRIMMAYSAPFFRSKPFKGFSKKCLFFMRCLKNPIQLHRGSPTRNTPYDFLPPSSFTSGRHLFVTRNLLGRV